ncbi:facilitated trehalose transporter Tret1-2 homolog [Condylostylus longicornis]|uniref:facilitated trehalose transporter Tret1-2 homolog n=1 Tax=Condylostylus longicornis TaxID=2530218 RepID=UPI00244E563E|nr:facilitated trehalose transporter Tret1-2 homolog [Condylostylus longicornis]XP_055374300.1 facilitated trehalose transporter Tret1-2 homolog [Condylostylus longicornis]
MDETKALNGETKMNGFNGETKALNGKMYPQINNDLNKPLTKLKPLGLRSKAVMRQVTKVILANLSVVSGGMALGYPAVTLKQLTDPIYSNALTVSQASWFASINAISCPLGGLLSGYLLDKIGRKGTIITINFTAIIAWLIMATAFHEENLAFFIQIMISRFVIGITTGLSSSPCGVYAAEVCHPNLRGRLTLGTSIGTALGIFLIYTMGYFIRNDWRLISILAGSYAVFALLLSFSIPESPSWLLSKKRQEESKKVHRYFRGLKKTDNYCYEEIDIEFSRMEKAALNPIGQKKKKFVKMLRKPEVWKPLLIMIGFFGCQQFSGIFVVIVYAVQFSIEAGVNIDPVLCAMMVGLTRMVTTFLVGYLLDKWGRRPPALMSGFGMAICMMLLAGCTWFPALADVPYLPVGCIVMYIFTSTLGLMTLPFSMISEVYPQKVRGQCAGITICFGYLMSFIIINRYPFMVENMGKENVFAFYGVVSLLAILFIYFFLPETKGKSLHEIEEYFIYGKSGKPAEPTEVEMKEIFVK